jgi:IS30 family transposase
MAAYIWNANPAKWNVVPPAMNSWDALEAYVTDQSRYVYWSTPVLHKSINVGARKARLGDWEGDTVVSAGHKGGLLTLVERKTQLAKIIKLPRATAHATQRAAVRRLKPIGDFVHAITFDNGKEFAAHQDIAHALKAKIFLATHITHGSVA